MIINLLKLCYIDTLNNIFINNKKINSVIIDKINISIQKFNLSLRLLIICYLILIFVINVVFIIFFFYKFKLDYFNYSRSITSKIPYLKNVNNFIIANLLLHYE